MLRNVVKKCQEIRILCEGIQMTFLLDSSPIPERVSYNSSKTTELKSQYNLKVPW